MRWSFLKKMLLSQKKVQNYLILIYKENDEYLKNSRQKIANNLPYDDINTLTLKQGVIQLNQEEFYELTQKNIFPNIKIFIMDYKIKFIK